MTAPYVARETSLAGIRSTCVLCGASNAFYGLCEEAADVWEANHAEVCTPGAVRCRAAGLRDAAGEVLRIAREGAPSLWDQGDGRQVLVAVLNGLRERAAVLDERVDAALKSGREEAA